MLVALGRGHNTWAQNDQPDPRRPRTAPQPTAGRLVQCRGDGGPSQEGHRLADLRGDLSGPTCRPQASGTGHQEPRAAASEG